MPITVHLGDLIELRIIIWGWLVRIPRGKWVGKVIIHDNLCFKPLIKKLMSKGLEILMALFVRSLGGLKKSLCKSLSLFSEATLKSLKGGFSKPMIQINYRKPAKWLIDDWP